MPPAYHSLPFRRSATPRAPPLPCICEQQGESFDSLRGPCGPLSGYGISLCLDGGVLSVDGADDEQDPDHQRDGQRQAYLPAADEAGEYVAIKSAL